MGHFVFLFTILQSIFACDVIFNFVILLKYFHLFATVLKEEDGPDIQNSFRRQESGKNTNLFLPQIFWQNTETGQILKI